MADEKTDAGDRIPTGRQNIYLPGYRREFSPKDVARITNLSPISIRLIYRQLHIGEKVDGRIRFTADDVARIKERQKTLHHHSEGEIVNMSKRPAEDQLDHGRPVRPQFTYSRFDLLNEFCGQQEVHTLPPLPLSAHKHIVCQGVSKVKHQKYIFRVLTPEPRCVHTMSMVGGES